MSSSSWPSLFIIIASFLTGFLFCSSIFLYNTTHNKETVSAIQNSLNNFSSRRTSTSTDNDKYSLDGLSILVAIASYNFNQIPHLEELLQSYRDVCEAGAAIDVVIHTTVPYPVVLIDLLNSRLKCANLSPDSGFSVKVAVVQPSIKFHLVAINSSIMFDLRFSFFRDLHRDLFYKHLDEYDLFVYTEDDMRVTASTLASYLNHTHKVISLIGKKSSASNNIGIVRYEYNYPSNVIIDDKTRHATANVTRVYWEHFKRPIFPQAAFPSRRKILKDKYITMKNHHQGMFIATRYLLKQWKHAPNCKFNVIRDRPSLALSPKIPTEGTQRVWMSSQMLYGTSHCNVRQLLPVEGFESLTVLHLPNKNYRRFGTQNRIGGRDKDFSFVKDKDGNYFVKVKNQTKNSSNGTDNESENQRYLELASQRFGKINKTKQHVDGASPLLITEIEFHIALRKKFAHILSSKTKGNYDGVITMVDEVDYSKTSEKKISFLKKFKNRMKLYHDYVSRGGVLSAKDMISDSLLDYIDF